MEVFLHSPRVWKKAAMGSKFQDKGNTLHCRVLLVLVRSSALTPLKTELLHLSSPPHTHTLGTVHRRKCGAGHQGELHHVALSGCHGHLEIPWGQVFSPASPPARHWASRLKSSVSSAFPEISGRVVCSKAFLWESDFYPSPRGAVETNSALFRSIQIRIIESLRLEKTSKIKSNRPPITTMPTKPYPKVPHLRVFWTPPGMRTPPPPWAACSNAWPLFQ